GLGDRPPDRRAQRRESGPGRARRRISRSARESEREAARVSRRAASQALPRLIRRASGPMDLELEGRTVVVTGASKGIGYACAEAFAREGAKVALVSRSAQNLDAALARLPAGKHKPIAIVADLVRAQDAARMAADIEAALGAIDVLVNSA